MYMFETSLYWTVLELTGSAVLVSLLLVSIVVPVLILTVPVGILVDRYGPSRLLGPAVGRGGGRRGHRGHRDRRFRPVGPDRARSWPLPRASFFGCWAIPAQVLASRVVDREQMPSAIGLSALPSGVGAVRGRSGWRDRPPGHRSSHRLGGRGRGLDALGDHHGGLPTLPGLGHSGSRALAVGDMRDALGWARHSPVGWLSSHSAPRPDSW